ncbi:MAG: hypothetical protein M3186_00855 [Actinomycetota bacterium]|nr:hypothetical protein [Actinomycetota bacterium]
MNAADIPLIEAPGPDAPPRAVQFSGRAPAVRRRGFLRIVGTAATTLGLTVLGWIPLARPAKAEQGSEHPDCGRYNDGPGGVICYGAPYSPSYCGRDKWFKDGCFGDWDDELTCYQPRTICRAGGEARDAWLWTADNAVYRCADGDVHYDGAPNLEQVICNAVLTQQPTKPSRSSQLL